MNPKVELHIQGQGVVTLELDEQKAPKTVANFLNAARSQDGNGYAVFGKVISGMDVVDKIRAVPTGPGDVPTTPVTIKKVTLEK